MFRVVIPNNSIFDQKFFSVEHCNQFTKKVKNNNPALNNIINKKMF